MNEHIMTPLAMAAGAGAGAPTSQTSAAASTEAAAQGQTGKSTKVDLTGLMKQIWTKALEHDQRAGDFIVKGVKRAAEQDGEHLKAIVGAARAVWSWVRNLLLRVARMLGYKAAIPASPTEEQLKGDDPIAADLTPAAAEGEPAAEVGPELATAALLGEASRLIDHILEGGADLTIPDVSKPGQADVVQAHLQKLAAFRNHYYEQASAAEQALDDSIRPHAQTLGVELEAFKTQLLHEQAGPLLGGPSAGSMRVQMAAIGQLRAAVARADNAAAALMAAVDEAAQGATDAQHLDSVRRIRLTFDELFAGRAEREHNSAAQGYNSPNHTPQNDHAGHDESADQMTMTKDSAPVEGAHLSQAEQSPLVVGNPFAVLGRGRIKVPGDHGSGPAEGSRRERDVAIT